MLSSWMYAMYCEIMTSKRGTRPYRKTKRARQQEETRRRITRAAVELHGTVGPAKAGVTDVAKLAGVSRMTVYSHFPTERDLFMACSSHWASENPFPDPSAWAEIDGPVERLGTALRELYAWYGQKQDMLGKVLRDTPLLPALGSVMDELWWPYLGAVVEVLLPGWPHGPSEPPRVRAALSLAVDFGTWQTLTRSGLDDAQGAELVARMISQVLGDGLR